VELTERAWSAGEADILDVIQARRHHASVSDDAVIAVLACLEASTEIQSLLNLEEK
jgi:outer membrane protein TolC